MLENLTLLAFKLTKEIAESLALAVIFFRKLYWHLDNLEWITLSDPAFFYRFRKEQVLEKVENSLADNCPVLLDRSIRRSTSQHYGWPLLAMKEETELVETQSSLRVLRKEVASQGDVFLWRGFFKTGKLAGFEIISQWGGLKWNVELIGNPSSPISVSLMIQCNEESGAKMEKVDLPQTSVMYLRISSSEWERRWTVWAAFSRVSVGSVDEKLGFSQKSFERWIATKGHIWLNQMNCSADSHSHLFTDAKNAGNMLRFKQEAAKGVGKERDCIKRNVSDPWEHQKVTILCQHNTLLFLL